MFRNQTLLLQGPTPGGAAAINARLEAMRASGMSATAIRRALGLSEMRAVACGLMVPASARPASSRLGAGDAPGRTGARGGGADAAGACMMDVVEAVARAGGVRPKDLIGRGQTRPLTRARQLAMHLLRESHPGVSLHAIGVLLDRDHTTVLYGCRRAAALLARDGAFRELYERARRELASPGRRATEAGPTEADPTEADR
ncbi:MAG: hypothetical protein IH993_09495 [Proteobacteria bacterium]|nr:hypothetical protein [Pseudomonadota bacterium]